MQDQDTTKDKPQRLPNGHFAPGSKGGPGNPLGKTTEWFRHCLMKAVTRKDLLLVYQALLARAKEGDVKAIQIFLDRACGKVKDTLEVAGASSDGRGITVRIVPERRPGEPGPGEPAKE